MLLHVGNTSKAERNVAILCMARCADAPDLAVMPPSLPRHTYTLILPSPACDICACRAVPPLQL